MLSPAGGRGRAPVRAHGLGELHDPAHEAELDGLPGAVLRGRRGAGRRGRPSRQRFPVFRLTPSYNEFFSNV